MVQPIAKMCVSLTPQTETNQHTEFCVFYTFHSTHSALATQSTAVAQEVDAVLYCCEAPEMFYRLQNFTWPSIYQSRSWVKLFESVQIKHYFHLSIPKSQSQLQTSAASIWHLRLFQEDPRRDSQYLGAAQRLRWGHHRWQWEQVSGTVSLH